jgi:hypothetical protein
MLECKGRYNTLLRINKEAGLWEASGDSGEAFAPPLRFRYNEWLVLPNFSP